MNNQKDEVTELHQKRIREFTEQICEAISSIPGPLVKEKPADAGYTGEAAVPKEEHSGYEKIHEKKGAQETVTLDPTKQAEVMNLVRQKSDDFQRELERMPALKKENIELAAQKFGKELMTTVHQELDKRKYSFAR